MTLHETWNEWLDQYATNGYFIARGVLDGQEVQRLREHVDRALVDAQSGGDDAPRLDPERGARQDDRESSDLQARFRKIGQLGLHNADFWNDFHCHPNVLAIMQRLLGDDIRLMFSGAFLKPARHGGATPWHQDLALWKYKATTAPTIWTAIDPATRENGCLQVVPGSHLSGEAEHVLYDGGLHKEIRRDLLVDVEPVHVELAAGDAAVWTAALFHYSPPNQSENSRLGVNGVYCSQQQASAFGPSCKLKLPWVVKDGTVCRH